MFNVRNNAVPLASEETQAEELSCKGHRLKFQKNGQKFDRATLMQREFLNVEMKFL